MAVHGRHPDFHAMPRYDYQCEDCGDVREHFFLMSEKPAEIECECGGVCSSIISGFVEVMVTGSTRPFKLDATCMPVGWEKGNVDNVAQEREYQRVIGNHKKLARRHDKQAIKGGIRHIGSVPRELHRMRQNQYGKDYWQQDTKKRLAEDDLLFKN